MPMKSIIKPRKSQTIKMIKKKTKKTLTEKFSYLNYIINEKIHSTHILPKTWPAIILPSSPATAARAFLSLTY